jgi:hypothetical protein
MKNAKLKMADMTDGVLNLVFHFEFFILNF